MPALTAELQTVEDSLPETSTGWAVRMRLQNAVGAVELAVAALVHIADDLPLRAGGTVVGRRLKRPTALLIDAGASLSDLAARASTLDHALAAAGTQDRASLRQLIGEVALEIGALDQLEAAIAG